MTALLIVGGVVAGGVFVVGVATVTIVALSYRVPETVQADFEAKHGQVTR